MKFNVPSWFKLNDLRLYFDEHLAILTYTGMYASVIKEYPYIPSMTMVDEDAKSYLREHGIVIVK